ncbi:MAG: beta-propeller domain-containing protein [Oscillospiraceae bacterium]|nr:beta-propeller domain-containing protein [Oscillospiraceae bacterium]
MNRSDPTEDLLAIAQRMKELDRQVPVPFAATAQGMQARLSSPGAFGDAKAHLPKKWRWSLVSLLLVAVISCALWPALSEFSLLDHAVGSNNAKGTQATVAEDADEAAPQAALGEKANDSFYPKTVSSSTSLRGSSAEGGASSAAAAEVVSIYYPAEDYDQIQLALDAIPASAGNFSPFSLDPENDFLPGADSSVSLADSSYQYTLTCTPEGASQLTIRSAADGTVLSQSDVTCIRGTLFTQGDKLILAGEHPEGTLLQIFDISDPAAPVLERTLLQEGGYLGAWKSGKTLLLSSLYQVDSAVDYIPAVYDSQDNEKKRLAADQILLSDNCLSASFAVVTAVLLDADVPCTSFAVLGGNGVDFSADELTVSTAGNDDAFSIKKEQLYLDISTVASSKAG